MKKILAIWIALLMLGSVTACQQSIDDLENMPPISTPALQEEQSSESAYTFDYTSIEITNDETIIKYPDQEMELPTHSNPTTEMIEYPKTFSKLMEFLGEEGLIVAGRAFGEREGHRGYLTAYTLTQFQVEKVYYGATSEKILTIKERFCPVTTETETYIAYYTKHTMLRNDRPVLLFLMPTQYIEGAYYPVYYELPLPEDYLNYNEEDLTELLDFYRGESSAYKSVEQEAGVEYGTVENPDGSITELITVKDSDLWPEKDFSDAEMLEEMSDHILIQVSAWYKIKIWPKGHIRFESEINDFSAEGLYAVSNYKRH